MQGQSGECYWPVAPKRESAPEPASAFVTSSPVAVLYGYMEASSSMTLPARPGHVGDALSPAFESLFRAEYARVVGIAHRVLADQAEAEDVAQDVFVSFYRSHPAEASYAPA